jgi:hypothetical protein
VIIYDATPAGGMPVTEPMSNVEEVLQGSISEDSATESAEKKRRFAVGKIAVVAGVIAVIAVTIALIVG